MRLSLEDEHRARPLSDCPAFSAEYSEYLSKHSLLSHFETSVAQLFVVHSQSCLALAGDLRGEILMGWASVRQRSLVRMSPNCLLQLVQSNYDCFCDQLAHLG